MLTSGQCTCSKRQDASVRSQMLVDSYTGGHVVSSDCIISEKYEKSPLVTTEKKWSYLKQPKKEANGRGMVRREKNQQGPQRLK